MPKDFFGIKRKDAASAAAPLFLLCFKKLLRGWKKRTNKTAETDKASGPRYLNQIGKDADDSRTLVDILCKRVIRPDFDQGKIPGRVEGVEDMASSVGDVTRRLISDCEWAEICQRVHAWQDVLETCSGSYEKSPLSRILGKATKFPTVARVTTLLGEEMSELYSEALAQIEADSESFAEFPDDKTNGGWNKHSAERAVSLVVDVIAPHGRNPEGMSAAYVKYMQEYRSQSREKRITHNADRDARKAAARGLGIWLPMPGDSKLWESDPRTCDKAAEFERLSIRVTDKMRIMRSVLQFIPRRRFSNHTVADMEANMARMRSYIKDSENRDEVKKTKTKKRPREEEEEEGEETLRAKKHSKF
jgi:hypothetical protein